MPVKKGAHGKMRHYNSRTGRYEKENIALLIQNKELSKQEKEILRRENLKNKAKNSKDELLPNVYNELDNALPGCVIGVNNLIFDKANNKTREIDLETKNYIIEVKSGIARRSATQFIEQQKYAESIGKKALVYAPNILLSVEADYKKKGIHIVKSTGELVKIIKGEKKI